MAFNNRKSWRTKFMDIDASYRVREADNEYNGFIVVRGPKGKARPTYFPKGNAEAIDAVMGVGSADWPDLLEAKAYNTDYPIYISAPEGTSAAYPSYLGGIYITKNGAYNFYNVKSNDDIINGTGNAYKVKVSPGFEKKFSKDFLNTNSQITIASPMFTTLASGSQTGSATIDGTTISVTFKNESPASISFRKPSRLAAVAIDYDQMRNGLVSTAGTDSTYWFDDSSIWLFTENTATLPNFGIQYSKDAIESNIDSLRDWLGSANEHALLQKINAGQYNTAAEFLLRGTASGMDAAIPFGIPDMFTYVVDITDITKQLFMQKGPTEVVTTATISDIGYDKYAYDKMLNYAEGTVTTDKSIEFTDNGVTVTTSYSATGKTIASIQDAYIGIYSRESSTISYIAKYDELNQKYYVTSDLNTKRVAFQKNYAKNTTADGIYHTIYYIEDGNKCIKTYTEEDFVDLYGSEAGLEKYVANLVGIPTYGTATYYSAIKNPRFNLLALENSEKVNGKTVSSGKIIGSLDPAGKDLNGNDCYWQDVLQDDDLAFLETRVVSAFGDDPSDLDEHGFWTGARIVDPYDIDGNGDFAKSKTYSISGDRFCTLVMEMNKMQNKNGGVWREEYANIIADGLKEATLPEYDDVYVFMEPTGQEQFKAALADISASQEMAAVISPKILIPDARGLFTDAMAQKVVVNGRVDMGSNAQFAGEFEVKDEITKKKYWCQPIGSVGKQIARSHEFRYGGAAPAWQNIEHDVGGQLKDRNFLRSRYQFVDDRTGDATKTLDEKGINPIAFTKDEGVMILSHRTTKDPNADSQWSYLGHTLSFQSVKREIRDNVMRPQVLKPINKFWMGIRQGQVDKILAKRLTGSDPVWDAATCDIEKVNTAQTKRDKNFIIAVDVWPPEFSESVTLILTNHGPEA